VGCDQTYLGSTLLRLSLVIISNGYSKYILAATAAEAERRGLLSAFLTGAYPTPLVRSILALPGLRSNVKLNRLKARAEKLDDHRVHAFFLSELLYQLGAKFNEGMVLSSFRSYSLAAKRHIRRAAAEGARIYHYRAGMGGDSIAVAKGLGMIALCDHAIAHPALVEHLVKNRGEMLETPQPAQISRFWRHVQSDIDQADAVLVNSDFVKLTFEFVGFDCSRIHVIYLGVDDSFMMQIPERGSAGPELRLLFAGSFEKRKGADILIDALRQVGELPWRLEIAGNLPPHVLNENRDFFSDSRVHYLGVRTRKQLADAMSHSDVFVFPSLAEGSARVIFEAMACGCYIVTTPNSGSIVEHGVHGSIVPPGDSAAVTRAIEEVYQSRRQSAEIGLRNAQLIKSKYRQCNYGDQLEALYKSLLNKA
jgi:glycosyltransferase involved in cell wall biosynthesis